MSTTIDSKSSDQAGKDAEKEINNAFPDDQSKEEAAKRLADTLTQPEVKKAAYDDIKVLANTIRSIRTNFLKVKGELLQFDNEKFKDTSGELIQLTPEWSGYIGQFDATLQRSLEEATEAVATMKTITAVLGDVQVDWRDDLVTELENFLDALKGKEAKSLEIKNAFQKLSDDVKLFGTKIDIALENAGAAIKADLQKAQDTLTDLTKQLKTINEKIDSLGKALKDLNAGALDVVASVFTLNPFAIVKSVQALQKAKGMQKDLDEANKQKDGIDKSIRETKQQIATLESREKLLEKYRKTLTDTKVTVESISREIGVIANIWSTINLDMRELHKTISDQFKPGQKLTRFFLTKLGLAKEMYKHLTLLLQIYVEEVKVAGPAK